MVPSSDSSGNSVPRGNYELSVASSADSLEITRYHKDLDFRSQATDICSDIQSRAAILMPYATAAITPAAESFLTNAALSNIKCRNTVERIDEQLWFRPIIQTPCAWSRHDISIFLRYYNCTRIRSVLLLVLLSDLAKGKPHRPQGTYNM